MRYTGECVDGYLPALMDGRVIRIGEGPRARLVVSYPWGLLYPRVDNVSVVGRKEEAAA